MASAAGFDASGSWLVASAPAIAGRAGQAAAQTATSDASQPIGPGTAVVPGAPGGVGTPTAPASPFGGGFLFLMIGLLGLMIFMSSMSARKEKKKRAELMSSLARYDRVQTIGGVIGTIVELKDTEVVLKVDESTNTKITFARSSVQGVLKKGPGGPASSTEANLPAGAKA
jgi:preprotein translocase subunit YajC